jgi:multiple sugar transport system substrate-binding protein
MHRRIVSRRRFLESSLALGGAVAAGLVAACGGGTGGSPVAPKTDAPAAKEPPSKEVPSKEAPKPGAAPEPTAIPSANLGSGGTVINFWCGLTGNDGEGMQRLMERYVQQNPQVTINFQRIVWRTFYDKLSASLVANNPPEMWIFHSEQVIRYASRGLMKQLDDLVTTPGQAIPIDDMGYTLPFARYDGKLFSVPLDQYTWCILYNKELIQAAGLDPEKPPQTVQEFVEWGRRATVDGSGKRPGEAGFDPKNVKQWGYYFNAHSPLWQAMLAQQGVPPMITGSEAKDVNTDSPEAVKALTEMVAWREQHGFAPDPTGVTVMDGYWAGKVAMTYNGVWTTNGIRAHPEIKTGIGLTPKFFNDQKAMFSGHQIAMPASLEGKKLEETWKVIKFLSDNSLEWAKEGQTPARKSVLNSKEFEELWPQSVFAKQLPTGLNLQPHLKLIELGDQITPALESALAGAKKPEEALKEAAQRQRQILARRD